MRSIVTLFFLLSNLILYAEVIPNLEDLRVPPANQLEALFGDRVGQYSIRITKQWRLCFVWQNGNGYDVEIIDYH